MTNSKWDYDLVVIGGGSGGYAAARSAVSHKLSVAVIEGGTEVGGLCILRGCMPTKALLYAAEVSHLAKESAVWGLQIPQVGHDFAEVMNRKNRIIGEFADYRKEQLEDGRFDFIRDHARFIDPHTVLLKSGSKVTAKSFIISTGSKVSPPPLADLDNVGYITSDEALALKTAPKSLIVLGGGAVAVELAQFFQRMGTQVTLIQRSETILKEFEADAAKEVERALIAEGMQLFTQTKLLAAKAKDGFKEIEFEHEGERKRVQADEILMALGRQPNTSGIGLDEIGVETKKGRVQCNNKMQSSLPHIFAAGDCTGPYDVVHIAIQQGEIAANNIAFPEQAKEIDYRLLISVVFTDPQIGQTGITEAEAKESGIEYKTASYPFNDHGKSLIMNALFGFVKLIANAKTGEILGGTCVGPSGGELIHEITVAMAARMTVHQFAAIPHYHPTLAEIWTYPAEDLADEIQI
ncbi:NAD(P)/FAD-dependent oxidoreductase [Verrucomicrobia bacterium]|jgi:dihydrolipoamide dehydrogenase|nr:NAD(P)/FAD-dependent oxidoreductase [Verrucomicrobiota bacterium]MDA7657706.1 NAD(P)/FAD-dependent oxidoreductase [Verrucomicrobiota bacterium]MDA7680233.1 NAD(P)/FAD-dependent oxidoreductase [bacterium]